MLVSWLVNTDPQFLKNIYTYMTQVFNRLHRSWQLKLFSSLLLRRRLFNLLIIYGSSSHLRSAHVNVRKYVGIPNCLTIASTPQRRGNWCLTDVNQCLTNISRYLTYPKKLLFLNIGKYWLGWLSMVNIGWILVSTFSFIKMFNHY